MNPINRNFPEDKWLDKFLDLKAKILKINKDLMKFHGENIMSKKICAVCHWNFEDEGHDKDCPVLALEKMAEELKK